MAKPLHKKRGGWASATKGLAALALGALCIPMFTAAPAAQAVPEYDLVGELVGAPAQLESGDLLLAQWNVSTNDDQAAAGNGIVDNVVVTLTAAGGRFTTIPDACLLDGVDPVSALSNGNTTLTCNLGTQVEGTAAGVLVNVAADPAQALDAITLTGEAGGKTVTLDPVPIVWGFGMDIDWGTPNSTLVKSDDYVDVPIQWTLYLEDGSVAGPDSISYDLDVVAANGPVFEVAPQACSEYSAGGTTVTHPWSVGTRPAAQSAPFVDSCELVHVSGNTYRLTLTGIDYSLIQLPTHSSNNTPLPAGRAAVATGEVWFRVFTTTNSSLKVTATAPQYISANGLFTADDNPDNNVSTKAFTFDGAMSAAWTRAMTNSGGTFWDDSYRVTPGTTVRTTVSSLMYPSNDGVNGRCMVLDTKYVTFKTAFTQLTFWDSTATVVQDLPSAAWEYYVGDDPALDPASPDYRILNFNCNIATGWVSTPPADLTEVRAVRVTFPMAEAAPYQRVNLFVDEVVKPTVLAGQDIWTMGTIYTNDTWRGLGTVGNSMTPTPGLTYPETTTVRDVLRVVGATPVVNKSVDRATVKPGDEAAFTLKYSANVSQLDADPIDNFVLTDTLPVGMEYVAGSATPEPVVSTNAGRQVLTWTLNGVAANTEHALTYNAVAGGAAQTGVPLVNTVDAVINAPNWPSGVSQPTASSKAQVVQTTNGYTSIGKTADQAFIPNIAGDGVGAGSWTVTLKSFDPVAQAYTDTIDVLPYNGDGRGTDYSGTYAVTGVDAAAGAEVYVTTVDPATLSDDPNNAMNGTAGDVTGNTVNWTLVDPAADFPAGVTAIRVIGSKMAPGATEAFTVHIETDGVEGGDVFVNRAQARAEHTKLLMRTSAALPVAPFYSASLKKYVQASDGTWHDANTVEDYPTFHPGDKVTYRITVENTGQGELTNIVIADDKQPTLGKHTIVSLAPGDSESHEYTVTLGADLGTLVNMATASAAESPVGTMPEIKPDPAGISIVPAPAPDAAFGNVVLEKRLDGLNAGDAAVKNQVFKIDVTCQAPAADGSAGEVLWTGTVKIKGGQKKLLIDETGQARVLPGGTRCYAAETDRGGADRTTIANDSWDNALVVTGGTQENPQRLHLVVTNTFGPTSLAMTGFTVSGALLLAVVLGGAGLLLVSARKRRLNM